MLENFEGVTAAVALRSVPQRFQMDTLAQTTPSLYEAAGSPLTMFGGQGRDDTPGVLLSSQLADLLHARVGDELPVQGTPTSLSGVFEYPEDGRESILASSAVVTVPPTGLFDMCLITVWPANSEVDGIIQTTVVEKAVQVEPPVTKRLNPTLGPARSTGELLDERPTGPIIYAGAALAFALGFILIRSRKLELAVAQHLGQTKTNQILQILIETLIWVAAGLFIGIVSAAVLTVYDVTHRETIFLLKEISSNAIGISLFALTGAVLAGLTVRGSKMQAWSKDR
jgi:hypothetical protein